MSRFACLEIPTFLTAAQLKTYVLPPLLAASAHHGVPLRLELNAPGSYDVGGTTPDVALVRELLQDYDVDQEPAREVPPLRIMIRAAPSSTQGEPPGEEFVPSDDELACMSSEICAFVSATTDHGRPLLRKGVDGFVFGVLRHGEEPMLEPMRRFMLDYESVARLVALADGYPCTFHRAFDALLDGDDGDIIRLAANRTNERALWALRVADPVRNLVDAAVEAVLTSGGGWPEGRAADPRRLEVLRGVVEEVEVFARSRHRMMEVVVGGGVRSGNVQSLLEGLDATVTAGQTDPGEEQHVRLSMHSSCRRSGGNRNEFDGFDVQEALEAIEVIGRVVRRGG